MSFVREFKSAIIISLAVLVGIFLLIMPLSNYWVLPDFLWFLENRSLLNYLSQYVPQIMGMVAFFGLVLLLLTIWRKK